MDLLWDAVPGTGASRVHTVRVVRVADLLQDDGEMVYEGMVAAYNLVWANTDFELQHCGVAVRRRHSPFEVAYTITSNRPSARASATSCWTCGRSRDSTGTCAW